MENLNLCTHLCDYSNSPIATNMAELKMGEEIAGEKVDWSFNLAKEDLYPLLSLKFKK